MRRKKLKDHDLGMFTHVNDLNCMIMVKIIMGIFTREECYVEEKVAEAFE